MLKARCCSKHRGPLVVNSVAGVPHQLQLLHDGCMMDALGLQDTVKQCAASQHRLLGVRKMQRASSDQTAGYRLGASTAHLEVHLG